MNIIVGVVVAGAAVLYFYDLFLRITNPLFIVLSLIVLAIIMFSEKK